MGAICGVYNQNLVPLNPEELNRMLMKMNHYKEKAEYSFNRGPIGLIEINLNVLLEKRKDNKIINFEEYYIVADCRIDNKKNLIRELEIRDSQISDPELILLSYMKWKERCVHYLIGDFTFAIWNSKENVLFCARDHLGMRPLFYKLKKNSFLFATDIRAIHNTFGITNWDTDYLADFLYKKGMPNDFDTPYPEVKQLPKGSYAIITPTKVSVCKYWTLDYKKKIIYKDDMAYVEHFTEIFKEAVHQRMRGSGPVSIFMSGGLDSTSIYAQAKKLQHPNTISTISCVFDEYKEADERNYIMAMLEMYKENNYHFLVSDNYWILKNFPNYAPEMDEPNRNALSYGMVYNSYLMAKKNGAKIALTGYAGDQVFGYNPYYITSYLRRLQFGDFINEAKLLSKQNNDTLLWTVKNYVLKTFKQQHEPPTILLPNIHNMCQERFQERNQIKDPGIRAHYDYIDQSQNLYLRRLVSESLGIEERHPFLDVRLVEFLFSIPLEQKIKNAETKVLLRKSMKNLLPSTILNQSGKASTNMLLFQGLRNEWKQLQPKLKSPILADLGLIDGSKFLDKITRYRHGELTRGMEYLSALQLELWLQEHTK
ncbi:asparagine synthetase [Bacillus cereus]|uniref:asparagine synthase-related protein n=1 Tax=Bacillus cereus TaxID=1396 RepID=UPI001EEF6B32|nr:asparagine synthase-related protein [Bacillus cereus]BCC39743.1 asparagine synthetase [Bacillus cereus]BCC81173.1 asparagine synthetase [Bacillus cereus]